MDDKPADTPQNAARRAAQDETVKRLMNAGVTVVIGGVEVEPELTPYQRFLRDFAAAVRKCGIRLVEDRPS